MKNPFVQALGGLIVILLMAPSQPGYSQTFGTPLIAANPHDGINGNLGQYNSMQIVSGYPAICTSDFTRGNLVFIRATNADGTAWAQPVIIDATGNVGTYISLQIVNGNPAVSYYDAANGDLKYVRANDANGTSWGSPQTLDAANIVGQYTSLQVVNGSPAIAYYDVTNQDVKYLRATDANGATWDAAQTLDGTGALNVGQYTSLQVINGSPAVAYYDATNLDVKYIRATDANGTTWDAAQTLAGTGALNVGEHTSLQVINGNPAVVYYDQTNTDLKFIRATDASGTTWAAAQTIDGTGGQYPSLQVLNGNPVIAFYDNTSFDLKYIRATDANGTAWSTAQTPDAPGTVGLYPSLIEVNGTPAIAYYDATVSNLKYIRATDADGTSWSSFVSWDVAGSWGQYNSLQLVNGNPAIAFFDNSNANLNYVRATNADGTSWGTVQTLDAAGLVGLYASMQIVDGNPAIAYYDVTNQDLKFIRAVNADGSAWGAPQTLDGTGGINVGQFVSLQVVNGNPAISYYDVTNTNLKYMRATDASGTTWDAPQTLDGTGLSVGQYSSLQIVNGYPAVVYYNASDTRLKFIRATNADGTAWATVQTIDAAGGSGNWNSLQVINGNPAVAYYNNSSADLKYVRATDADGTAWAAAQTLDGVGFSAGQYASLQTVNGNPAISYYDGTNVDLKFIRATDPDGTGWAAPQTAASKGSIGQYTSMISRGAGVAIAYFDGSKASPMFISTPDFILPVTLTHIAAQWKNTAINLTWKVADETNIDQYIIERSADGRIYSALGRIAATNVIGLHEYNYLDAAPLPGINFYRLRILERSGLVRYSAVVTMRANQLAADQVTVYPNPLRNNALQFEVCLPAGTYALKLFNSAGVAVMNKKYQHSGGSIVNVLPLQFNISGGIYHLIISNNKVQVSTRFVK